MSSDLLAPPVRAPTVNTTLPSIQMDDGYRLSAIGLPLLSFLCQLMDSASRCSSFDRSLPLSLGLHFCKRENVSDKIARKVLLPNWLRGRTLPYKPFIRQGVCHLILTFDIYQNIPAYIFWTGNSNDDSNGMRPNVFFSLI